MVFDLLDSLRTSTSGSYGVQISFVPDRTGHDSMDCQKMQKELIWRPSKTFSTGMQKTVNWYLGNL